MHRIQDMCTSNVYFFCNAVAEAANISSEVSAIYLAMKNSKLECLDEHGQDHMSTDLYVDDDDTEEFDDFDPYLFIKNLPDLSSVVQTFRPLLLPKQTRSCPPTTLVLDLDGENNETLVSFIGLLYNIICTNIDVGNLFKLCISLLMKLRFDMSFGIAPILLLPS